MMQIKVDWCLKTIKHFVRKYYFILPLPDSKSIRYIRKFVIRKFVMTAKVCIDMILSLLRTPENFEISDIPLNC